VAAIVAVRVDDVAPNRYTLDRATVRQRRAGRLVWFELTERTRQAIEHLRMTCSKRGEFFFPRSRRTSWSHDASYPRLVGQWITVRYLGIEIDDAIGVAEKV